MGEYFVDAVTKNDVNSVAAVTLFLGVYPNPVLRAVQSAVPRQPAPAARAHHPAPDRAVADAPARR